MAFNPFDTFRKNSKPLMAALTIFVMFVFVLSTGGGGNDFFDWIARQFGAEDRRGAVLGSIDGTDYHSQELQELRMKRTAANAFMTAAVSAADQQILGQIDQDVRNKAIKNPAVERTANEIMQWRKLLQSAERLDRLTLAQFRNRYEEMGIQASNMANSVNPKDNPVENRTLRRLARIVSNDIRRMTEPMYFVSVPNVTEQDALRFADYTFLADKMRVKFTDADVQKLIAEETESQLSEKDANTIVQSVLNHYRGVSTEQIFKAIGDEFRVMATMKVLGGWYYSGKPSFPAAMTPYEFFQFYKDRCADNTYEIVDVPVENFLDQVKDQPTDPELRKLFDLYKKEEYDPSRERPGFKEPRQVKLEYFIIDPTAPVYKNTQPAVQAASTIAGGFTSTMFGGGWIPGVMTAADPVLAESWEIKEVLQSKLNRAKLRQDLFERNWDPFIRIGLKLIDSSYYQPLPAIWQRPGTWLRPAKLQTSRELNAAAAGGGISVHERSVRHDGLGGCRQCHPAELVETLDRAKVGVQLLLAPTSPEFPLTAAAALFANAPADPVPVYEAEARASVLSAYPKAMARYDVSSLEKKLDDLRTKMRDEKKEDLLKKKEPAKLDPKKIDEANDEARKYLNEWIKDHPGVKTGLSSGLRDRFRLVDDPALKVIFDPIRDHTNITQIIETLYFPDPNQSKDPGKATLFTPRVLSDINSRSPERDYEKPIHVVWKIEDVDPKTYNRFDDVPPEMRAEIIRAWKFEKARALAKTAADDFAVKARELAKKELVEAKNEDAFKKGLKELYEKAGFASVPSVTLAMLKKTAALPAGHRDMAPRYEGPRIQNKQIVFPPPDMANQLLEVRNKPLGETLVVPNVPKSHYYVSILMKKQDLKIESFYTDVFVNSNVPENRQQDADTLYRFAFQLVVAPEFREDLRGRLMAETKFKETEEMKKVLEKPNTNPDQ